MALEAGEFIRRFLLHAAPDGFHRIRHVGFLANGHRAAKLALCRILLAASKPEPLPVEDYRERHRRRTGLLRGDRRPKGTLSAGGFTMALVLNGGLFWDVGCGDGREIRRAFLVQGKSIKAICRDLRVSRKVVQKVLRSEATEFREREEQPLPRVGPWQEMLDQLLKAFISDSDFITRSPDRIV